MRSLLLARRGENTETCLKFLTIVSYRGQLAHLQSELVDPLKERKTDISGQGVVVRVRREYCSPVNVESIQRCDIYAPIPSACRF